MCIWKIQNKIDCKRLIIYRDGVSQSQKLQIVREEVNKIQEVLNVKYNKCQMLMIIVNKRISQKFFENTNENNR